MVKPEQSGFSPEPSPADLDAALLVDDARELAVEAALAGGVLDAGDAGAEDADARRDNRCRCCGRPAPSFIASLPSSSLQDDIDMTM